MKPRGYVIWHGPSRIDGQPVVVIATISSRNDKTGDVIQTWITRSDLDPISAVQSGADYSICGSCPLRGSAYNGHVHDRVCYVEFWREPQQIWRAYQRGVYPDTTRSQSARLVAGSVLRIGAYGDPTAIPYRIWSRLVSNAAGHTGYTHQWATGANWRYKALCMASTESREQSHTAHSNGWRTFRVMPIHERKTKNEKVCPSSMGQTTCNQCGQCNGGTGRNIAITVHGTIQKLAAFRRLTDRRNQ